MKRKILYIFASALVVSIFLPFGKYLAMQQDTAVIVKLLPIERVENPPSWQEGYYFKRFSFVGKGIGNEKVRSAWNVERTAMFQIADDGKRAVLSVKKGGHSWELISTSSKLGFGVDTVWSFDGKSFAVEKITAVNADDEIDGDIFVVRVDAKGKPLINLVFRGVFGSFMAWSHSGDKLVFADSDTVYLYSVRNSKLFKIATGYGSQSGYPARTGGFSWSADDNQIVFTYFAQRQDDKPEYYLISNINSISGK